MALGFGSTYGAGVSDRVISLSFAVASTHTLAVRVFRHGAGGSSAGRVVQTESVSGGFTLLWDNTNSRWSFSRVTSGTAGSWSFTDGAATDTWYSIVITQSGTAAPTVYIDGVSVTVTQQTAPSGSAGTGSVGHTIGNRDAGDRVWDGMIAELAVYDAQVSADEAKSLAIMAPLAVRLDALSLYFPFVRTTTDLIAARSRTVTGTAVQNHPRVGFAVAGGRFTFTSGGGGGGGSTFVPSVIMVL